MPDPSRAEPGSIRRIRTASWLLVPCGLILGFDLAGEVHEQARVPRRFDLADLLHLGGEMLAGAGLVWAFLVTRRELARQVASHRAERDALQALRGDFDRLIRRRFTDWGLSAAEQDVALLTLRGLKIAEIAHIRGANPGTVKAQLSSIFRKSGAANRTDLVARFIDEFLDVSAMR